jgi:hypothetical protein
MRTTFRLFVIVGTASLITTATYFGLILALLPLLQRPSLPRGVQVVALAVVVLTPVGVAAWWISKKLRSDYTARTARAAAIAFGVFTPVSLGVAFPLSAILGAYSEGLAGYPFFGLVGAFVGVVLVTALLSFVPCLFTIWIARRDDGAHQAH